MCHLVGCLLEVLHVVSQHQVTQGQEVAVVLARIFCKYDEITKIKSFKSFNVYV